MPRDPLATLIASLLAFPFVLLRDLYRFLRGLNRWRLHRAALPPPLLNRSRAVGATFALALTIDLATHLQPLTGRSLDELVGEFVLHTPHQPSAVLLVLAALSLVSLLFLIVGLIGARGAPTDIIAALIALSLGLACAALLHNDCYLPADFGEAARYGNPLLHALYVAVLTAVLLRAWLSVPLLGGSALRRLLRHIRQRTGNMRPVRPRPF